jgi:predicted site-specific integrase-resolvase
VKLSHYAKQQGISYSTALRWWHQGVIRDYQAPSGTITVETGGKQAKNRKEDLLHDLTSIVYSICARIYGQRRAKRKMEHVVEQLQAKEDDHATR